MGFVTVPVYLAHAEDDDVVPFQEAKHLYAAAPKDFPPFYPKTGKHDDVKETHPEDYYSRLRDFFALLRSKVEELGEIGFVDKHRGNLPMKWAHLYAEEFEPLFDAQTPGKNPV